MTGLVYSSVVLVAKRNPQCFYCFYSGVMDPVATLDSINMDGNENDGDDKSAKRSGSGTPALQEKIGLQPNRLQRDGPVELSRDSRQRSRNTLKRTAIKVPITLLRPD